MVGCVENLCAKVNSRVLSQGKLLRQCNIRLSGSKFSESVSASRSNHVWRWLVERRGIQLPSAPVQLRSVSGQTHPYSYSLAALLVHHLAGPAACSRG